MREIHITDSEKNQRLDKFLLKYMNRAPRSFVYKMLRKKNIKLNDKRAEGNEILDTGDCIKIFLSEETILSFTEEKTVKKTEKCFDTVYEDNNILLCNKPAGVIVHADIRNKDNTLNDSILYYLYTKGEYKTSDTFTPSICNRLDRNTSGIITAGKNLAAVQELSRIFKQRLADKYYITVVKGVIKEEGIVEGRHIKYNDNVASLSDNKGEGSYVLTKYRPLADNGEYTLLEVKLETGKSHQIRASMKYIGHPIIGDVKYGSSSVNKIFRDKYGLRNQLLHSSRIIFKAETGVLAYLNNREFICPPDSQYADIIENVFNYKIN